MNGENRYEEGNQTKKLIIVAIIAFVLGFLVAWLVWGNSQTSDVADNGSNNNDNITETNQSENGTGTNTDSNNSDTNSLVVSNQMPGQMVEVTDVNVSAPSWIAIREVIGGVPGNILGVKKVDAPTNSVEVNLLRGTVEGGSYQALIFTDDGDGIFNHRVDSSLESTAVLFTTSVASN